MWEVSREWQGSLGLPVGGRLAPKFMLVSAFGPGARRGESTMYLAPSLHTRAS